MLQYRLRMEAKLRQRKTTRSLIDRQQVVSRCTMDRLEHGVMIVLASHCGEQPARKSSCERTAGVRRNGGF